MAGAVNLNPVFYVTVPKNLGFGKDAGGNIRNGARAMFFLTTTVPALPIY